MDVRELSEYISVNKCVPFILEKLGMGDIKECGRYVTCSMPDGDNHCSTVVYTDPILTVLAHTRKIECNNGKKPNLYNLIMFINKCGFSSAINYCCNILGLSNKSTCKKTQGGIDLSYYKTYKRKNNRVVKEQIYYDLDILNSYSKIPHIDLIKNDALISQTILDKYLVRYDYRSERILFPHLKHDDKTKIAGIVGRTTIKAFKELKINKYMSMLKTEYMKSNNLYALSLNIEEIKKRNKVIIFEAEKSVMKADMMGYGIGVAVGCHDISSTQFKMLLKLNVEEIIIAFDKDVDLEHINKICKRFDLYRNISYIYDKWSLLKEKDSPVDRGIKKWKFLYDHRIKYNGE